MKYKLIKEYPGSPKLGYIYNPEQFEEYCNYTEFWEEVVEKDYEILSLSFTNNFCYLQKNGEYAYRDTPNTTSTLKGCLSVGWKIHSVNGNTKMNKKEEIFTIGDKTNNGTISKFEIDSNGVRVFFEEKPKNYHVSLNSIKHSKQKLFTSEDGVDIFENNTSIYILDKFTIRHIKHKDFNVISKHVKYFSKKEKAEEYILLNKPCLSLNDLKQFFPDTYVPFKKGESATEDVNTKQLEDLVKSKIQQSV